MTNATQHADKLRNKAGNLAMAGAGATATGAVIGAPVVTGLNEATHYHTEVGRVNALGLGDKVSAEAVAFARNMKTYGTTQRQIAAVCAKNHTHSVHNPFSQFRKPFTIDEVLAAPPITYPITLPM